MKSQTNLTLEKRKAWQPPFQGPFMEDQSHLTLRTPVCNEHTTSTSNQNCVQIQYLNPCWLKQVARASRLPRLVDDYGLPQLLSISAS